MVKLVLAMAILAGVAVPMINTANAGSCISTRVGNSVITTCN